MVIGKADSPEAAPAAATIPDALVVSALTGEGLAPFLHRVADLVESAFKRVLRTDKDRIELEIPVDGPDGRKWALLLVSTLEGCGVVVTKVDVTRVHKVLDLVSESALQDSLTRLPNRTLLEDRIATAIARTERGQARPAVLFLDLDRFKSINDELGHDMGDRVLATIAQRLNASLRSADSCGRWGGDEFVAVVEVDGADEHDALKGVVERIAGSLNAPIELRGQLFHVGVSIGAVPVRPGDSSTALIAMADTAMYDSKRKEHAVVVRREPTVDLRFEAGRQRRRRS